MNQLTNMHKNGGWVLLQNIHLTIDWTSGPLEKKVDKLTEGAHPDFRWGLPGPAGQCASCSACGPLMQQQGDRPPFWSQSCVSMCAPDSPWRPTSTTDGAPTCLLVVLLHLASIVQQQVSGTRGAAK